MPNPKTTAIVALLLLPALAGCEDPREFDLTLDPYLFLDEATWEYVRVYWDAYEDAAELKLERKKSGYEWEVLSVLPPTVKEYTDDTVEPGWNYKYRLRGVFDDGNYHLSVVLKVDVPEEPVAVPLSVAPMPTELVSPDGTRSARLVNERVWITNFRSGHVAPATRFELGPESDVVWMSDSRHILLVAGPEGASILYLYDPDSGESRVLAENAQHPAVAPDGRHVTFVVAGVTHTILPDVWETGR